MATLQYGEAHVWVLPVSKADDEGIVALSTLLSEQERARVEGISGKNDKRQFRAAHILTRLMLSEFSTVSPDQWHYETGPHGRLELSEEHRFTELRFNLTHAHNMVACAVTLKEDIGVDVEWMARSNRFSSIAEKKFSTPEIDHFANSPEDEKRRVFFSLWTLKESYIKAIGKGLAEPLDGFAFEVDPLAIRFLAENGDEEAWSLDLFEAGPEHLCAVCVGQSPLCPTRVHRRILCWGELAEMMA